MINNKNKKFLKAFGENLFRLRTERKLSQEELANEADIPINQVGRIERAEVNTTISTVYSLASALKVKPASLFDF